MTKEEIQHRIIEIRTAIQCFPVLIASKRITKEQLESLIFEYILELESMSMMLKKIKEDAKK